MRPTRLALATPLLLALAGPACAQRLAEPRTVDLSQVKEHMEVIGADGRHAGTVDKVEGRGVLLTGNDPASRGTHHTIPSAWLDTIDAGKLRLRRPASEAMAAWSRSGRPGDDPKER